MDFPRTSSFGKLCVGHISSSPKRRGCFKGAVSCLSRKPQVRWFLWLTLSPSGAVVVLETQNENPSAVLTELFGRCAGEIYAAVPFALPPNPDYLVCFSLGMAHTQIYTDG